VNNPIENSGFEIELRKASETLSGSHESSET
jgi:hypothetical protein